MILLEDISTNNRDRNFSQVLNEYGIDVNINEIIPGNYYSFNIPFNNFNEDWIPNSKDEYDNRYHITDKQYYDLKPFGPVFMHENWKNVVLQLNLRILPPKIRLKVIMSHINIIKEDLNTIGALDSESDNVSPLEMIKMSLNMVKILPSQLEYISGVKLNYAINAYKKIKGSGLLNIVNPKLLEWNKVGELPLANIEDKGIAIARGLSNIAGLFEQFERKQLNI